MIIEYTGGLTCHGSMPERTVAKCRLPRPLGQAQLERDTQAQPAEAVLAASVLDPHYAKILCVTRAELPPAFAKWVQCGVSTVQPAVDRCS